MRIAVLMTCYNRVETTIRCLKGLLAQVGNGRVEGVESVEVFVVDDGSTDGTGDSLTQIASSRLHLIRGTGNLYWAKGMHLAWKTCLQHEVEKVGGERYDGFLWLNDDVELAADALERLATTLQLQLETPTIIVGECVNAKGEVTYGIKGDLFDGNFVYVPRNVYEKIGMICGDYAHAWADSDYALKAKRAGVNVVSCGVIGKCEGHELRPRLKGKSLKERVRLLKDPKGWNLHDLWLYRRRNWGVCAAVVSCAHLVLHVLIGER